MPERPWAGPGRWRNRSRLVRWYRLWRTRRPVTFNDKVRYKMLRDHRPLMVVLADKAAVRGHVAHLVGPEHLPRAWGPFDSADELAAADLPRECVVKPTHGSGACVVLDDGAAASARLPPPVHGWVYSRVRPEHADRADLRDIAAGWLEKTYSRGPNHEWAYGRVPPRVLVEELLRAPDGGLPDDVKLFVVHGRCRFVQLDRGRFGDHTTDFFDRDGTPVDLVGGHPRGRVAPPAQLPEMVRLAERLGVGTDVVRVDLYGLGDRLLVGELTSTPAGGDSPFTPRGWDAEFSRSWQVPRRYR
ncbi:MAG: hypothetical protein JWL64_2485 [Frankiales bacterium]|nr:hypothetical protein [Frankiales bacterium]